MLRLAIEVDRESAERVLAELISLSPGGVEEIDRGKSIEYAIYAPPGEIPSLPLLEAVVGDVPIRVTTTEIADDWADRWRDFHQPLVINGLLRVRPPWEEQGVEEHDLVIDPGRAFGTGAHATTRLCLEQLLTTEGGGSLVDLGCGSGVIAILAAKIGFHPVIALDYDPLAVDATRQNAERNDTTLEVGLCDLRTDSVPSARVLVANILAPALRILRGRLPYDKPSTVILSGLLESELDGIAEDWGQASYSEVSRSSLEGWAALRLRLS